MVLSGRLEMNDVGSLVFRCSLCLYSGEIDTLWILSQFIETHLTVPVAIFRHNCNLYIHNTSAHIL